jgi:hypothetical protein
MDSEHTRGLVSITLTYSSFAFVRGEEMGKCNLVLFAPGTNRKAVLHCADIQ